MYIYIDIDIYIYTCMPAGSRARNFFPRVAAGVFITRASVDKKSSTFSVVPITHDSKTAGTANLSQNIKKCVLKGAL